MVSRSPADFSMLCPLLIDPAHPVITDRFKLMQEQPVAFVPKAPEKSTENEATPIEERPWKKRKSEKISSAPDEGIAAFGFHEDVSQWDLE